MDKFDRRLEEQRQLLGDEPSRCVRFRRTSRAVRGRINVAPSSRFAENLRDDGIINLCVISRDRWLCALVPSRVIYRSLSVYRSNHTLCQLAWVTSWRFTRIAFKSVRGFGFKRENNSDFSLIRFGVFNQSCTFDSLPIRKINSFLVINS